MTCAFCAERPGFSRTEVDGRMYWVCQECCKPAIFKPAYSRVPKIYAPHPILKKPDLTKEQRAVLGDLLELTKREGHAPTAKEVAMYMRRNEQTIRCTIGSLRRLGYIEWDVDVRHGIKVAA